MAKNNREFLLTDGIVIYFSECRNSLYLETKFDKWHAKYDVILQIVSRKKVIKKSYVTSYQKLSERWKWKEVTVKNFLKKLSRFEGLKITPIADTNEIELSFGINDIYRHIDYSQIEEII